MIDFNYKKTGDLFVITLKTDITMIGTFHRVAGVIYVLGWDIVSGSLSTTSENGHKYTFDTLTLKSDEKANSKNATAIGIIMDSVFSTQESSSDFFEKYKSKEPTVKNFFREKAELIFQDIPERNETCFYMEADSGRGLLYYVTKVLAENKININSGIIETDPVTQRAKDTFYLVDEQGRMFGKTRSAEELREKILTPLK